MCVISWCKSPVSPRPQENAGISPGNGGGGGWALTVGSLGTQEQQQNPLHVGAGEVRQQRRAAPVSATVAIASLLPFQSHPNVPPTATPVGNEQGRDLWVMQFGLVKLTLTQLPF